MRVCTCAHVRESWPIFFFAPVERRNSRTVRLCDAEPWSMVGEGNKTTDRSPRLMDWLNKENKRVLRAQRQDGERAWEVFYYSRRLFLVAQWWQSLGTHDHSRLGGEGEESCGICADFPIWKTIEPARNFCLW